MLSPCLAFAALLHKIVKKDATACAWPCNMSTMAHVLGHFHAIVMGAALCFAGCGRFGYEESGLPDAATVSVPDAASGEPGLIGHYLANPTSPESNALGSGANGLCANCPSVATERSVTAYDFNGTSTYVRIPYDERFAGESAFSVALWVKPRSYSMYMCIASKIYGSTFQNSWKIENATAALQFESYNGMSIQRVASGMTPLPLGEWSHIAITWDGQTKRVYWNGALTGEQATSILFDTGDVYIGVDYDYGSLTNFFDGLMRDIRLYNRPLTDSEIAVMATP